MQIPITYYLISICLNLLIILFLHKISFYIGLIDSPGKRKMHQGNIPVIGGISIYLSLIPLNVGHRRIVTPVMKKYQPVKDI